MKYAIATAVIVLVGLGTSRASAQQKFRTYTVKPGETCTSIAKKFYGDKRAYHHIHKYNDLSDQGYGCREGTRLQLPILAQKPEAKLMARAGRVRAKPPKSGWNPVDVGADLYETWRINTLNRSRAELGFRDDSQIQMTANTLVVIYGPTKETARRTVARRASVDKGRLKTRLSDLSGRRLQVDTPQAQATFQAGRGQVTVDDGESRVANHSGKPAAVTAPNGAAAVSVAAGQGTRVPTGKPPEPPRPLPPTPVWSQQFDPNTLVLAGTMATVRARWNAVSGARAYRVEVSRHRRQIEVLFSKRVPASINSLEMRQLPAGDYFVSIVAIDAAKFESIPSKLKQLHVVELGVDSPGAVDATADTVVLGTTIQPPRGMTCTVDSGADSSNLALNTAGDHQVSCSDDKLSVSTTAHVVKPSIHVDADGDSPLAIRQGALSTVDVDFEPGLPPGVLARSDGELEVKALRVGPRRMRINLRAAIDSPVGPARVGLMYEDVELGHLSVAVQSAAAASAPTDDDAPSAEFLALALLGYDAVGVDPYWDGGFPAGGGAVEVGLGTLPTRHFAGEVRMGFSAHSGSQVEQVISTRSQAMAGWFDAASAPYLGIGLAWQAHIGGADRFAPRASLGVMPAINARMRLRGEIGVDATPVDGRVRLLPEARLGMAFRF